MNVPVILYLLVGIGGFALSCYSFSCRPNSKWNSIYQYNNKRITALSERTPLSRVNNDKAVETSNGAEVIHVISDCDDETIEEVASFLIDAYWLSTPRLWTTSADVNNGLDNCDIPTQASILQKDAASYLRTQYGDRMGKRLLRTCIVVAEGETKEDTGATIAGLLCMHELIWDNDNILPDDESETILRNTVATIGPKDRRLYKDATAIDIANKLLPSTQKAVCVFSNLAVSSAFRRRGIGIQICQAAESVASEWGYDYLHLKVEAENIAAATLYQRKLGYILEQNLPTDPAIRLDLRAAEFVETAVETLILSKKLK